MAIVACSARIDANVLCSVPVKPAAHRRRRWFSTRTIRLPAVCRSKPFCPICVRLLDGPDETACTCAAATSGLVYSTVQLCIWTADGFSRSTDVTSTDLVSAKGKTKKVYCCDIVVLIVLFWCFWHCEGLQCRIIIILKHCMIRLWNDINQLTLPKLGQLSGCDVS